MCGSGQEWEWWAERLSALDTAYWQRYMRDPHPQPWHYPVVPTPPLPSVHMEQTVPRTVHMEHTALPSTGLLVDNPGVANQVARCLQVAQSQWEKDRRELFAVHRGLWNEWEDRLFHPY